MASTLSSFNLPDTNVKSVTQTSQMEIYGADKETLIRLLRSKMKYALAESGFDQEAQETVTRLVEQNTISCGIALRDSSVSGGVLQADLVQPQLEDLMSGEFRINSNEVVLLILVEHGGQVSAEAVRVIKEASCTVLRDVFHIYPVRVYVACTSDNTTRAESPGHGFSLALLNVVNTNIGGPGMIQLLDNEAASSDWQRMVLLAEAWNRTDLHWRRDELEKVERSKRPKPVETEVVQTSEIVEMYDKDENPTEPLGGTTSIPNDANVDLAEPESTQSQTTVNAPNSRDTTSDSVEIPEQPVMKDHPAMLELLARDANRPVIHHPSWEHSSGGDSLIDLIRMQALASTNTDTTADVADSEDAHE